MSQPFYFLHSPTIKLEPTILNDFEQALQWADKASIENAGHAVYVMASISLHQQQISAARTLIDITPATDPMRQLSAAA